MPKPESNHFYIILCFVDFGGEKCEYEIVDRKVQETIHYNQNFSSGFFIVIIVYKFYTIRLEKI